MPTMNAPLTVQGALTLASYADLQKQELRNARIQNLASAPASPVEGQVYYDTVAHALYWWNGTAWTLATGTTTSYGSPSTQAIGDSATDGVATSVSRSDHKHGMPAFGSVTAQTSFGASSGNGAAASVARSDHTHGTPTAPTASSIGAVANANGTPSIYQAAFASRPAFGTVGRLFIDTTNNIVQYDTGAAWVSLYDFGTTASTQAVGDAAAAGTAVTVSRSDHKHAMPSFGNASAQTSYGASSGNGSAATIARSDHTHGTPSLSSNVASTQAFGDSATNGTGTAPAKDDHKHAMPSLGNVTAQTSFGGASSNGVATTASRSDHVHGTPTHDASAHSAISLSAFSAPTGSLAMGSQKITGLSDGSAATDAASWGQVQTLVAGLDWKQAVRAISTTNITLASGAANGSSLGGVTLVTGDRILLAGQSTAAENGIYTVNGSGAPTRATDADASGEIKVGTVVPVQAGTGANTFYYCTATGATPWTTASSSTWSFLFTVTSTQAGAGLTASGNVLAVGAGTGISVGADSVAVDTSVVARKYTATGPSGAGTTWVVTHSLGNRDCVANLYDASTYATVYADEVRTDANTITYTFASSQGINSLRVAVIG